MTSFKQRFLKKNALKGNSVTIIYVSTYSYNSICSPNEKLIIDS